MKGQALPGRGPGGKERGGPRPQGLRGSPAPGAPGDPAGPGGPAGGGERGDSLLTGLRPICEALAAGVPLDRIWLSTEARGPASRDLVDLARARGVPVERLPRHALDRLAEGRGHRGALARLAAAPYLELEELLEAVSTGETAPFLLFLDGIEDPQNLGAILRTAEAAGVQGVVLPQRRAVGLTGAVLRASAGAAARVPVARVVNLRRALARVKEAGLRVVGADPAGPYLYTEVDLRGPVAAVVGAEGRGLSRLVGETCDLRVRIPMSGRVGSLNASVAAGVLLYEIVRQRLH